MLGVVLTLNIHKYVGLETPIDSCPKAFTVAVTATSGSGDRPVCVVWFCESLSLLCDPPLQRHTFPRDIPHTTSVLLYSPPNMLCGPDEAPLP